MGRKGVQYDKKAKRRIAEEYFKPRTMEQWMKFSCCYDNCPNPDSYACQVMGGINKLWCEECRNARNLSKSKTANTRTDYKPCEHYLDTLY